MEKIKASNVTTSEVVCFRLREMIQKGSLGDRLPPERDLAREMGVSRQTLRTGIRSLSASGFLQSRRGSGTFVVKTEDSPTLDSAPLRIMAKLHDFSVNEMFEARIALEIEIAELAAKNANSEQMTKMAEEITEMFSALDEPERFLIHDMLFHKSVAEASGNRMLMILMKLVTQVIFDTRSKTVNRATDLKQAAEMHRKIYRAIRDRNPLKAREAMREHLIATQKAQQMEEIEETV